MTSPFQFGREMRGSELVDRQTEVAQVVQTLQHAERLFLIGPRRFGKTSILVTATQQAEELGAIVLYVNAEKFAAISDIAADLIRQSASKLRSPVKKTMRLIGDIFRSLEPSINYNPLADTWSVKVASNRRESEAVYLTDTLDSIDALAATLDHPVAVVIDEFQQVVASEGVAAERQLRAVIQTHRNVGYVFAGSATAILTAMTSDHSRPFYRLGSNLFLGPVPRKDFAAYIEAAFDRSGRSIQPAAITAILDAAEDVPYSTQLLADKVWKNITATKVKQVDTHHVELAINQLLDLYDPQYATQLALLSPSQKKTLLAAAHSDGTELASMATHRQYNIPISTIRRALEALVNKSILRKHYYRDEPARFVFEDPFLKHWIRQVIKWNGE